MIKSTLSSLSSLAVLAASPIPPTKSMSDEEREQVIIQEKLEAHGSKFRHKHKNDPAWPKFEGQVSSLSKQPRIKQFVEPEELFVVSG